MSPETSTTTVTVFTRHAAECPQTNPQWKRCACRKSIYIYEGGKRSYKSARTRSWEEAERAAQVERDLRDPVKIQLKEIEAQRAREAAEKAAREANRITIEDALDRWLRSHKQIAPSSEAAYRAFIRKVKTWASDVDVTYLADVNAEMLDEWRGQWSPSAAHDDDKMGNTTQAHFQVRLKNFFAWANRIGLISVNPALALKSITPSKERTMPLTTSQFEELLAATSLYDAGRRATQGKFGKDLRALFLLMRWSGLRIADALMLPKSALVGNRLSLTTQKTKAPAELVLPDLVVAELAEYKSRPSTDPGYYFWSKQSGHLSMTTQWTARIRELNPYLKFQDEQGHPLPFRSHMLRDTFAVELLLAGVALEDVSRLLTHKSVRITERYYAPWVKARRVQLEDKLVKALRKMGATVGGN